MHENVTKNYTAKMLSQCATIKQEKRNKFRNLMKHLNYFVGLRSTAAGRMSRGRQQAAGKNIKKSNLYAK